jgi:hypothetical protein
VSTCSDYPWIEVYPVTRPSKADLGWTRAECQRCGQDSCDNAEPYTEDWTHEHAKKCHPRWTVRKGRCKPCADSKPGACLKAWVITDSTGATVGCSDDFYDAITYATRKAGICLQNELTTLGVTS